ncbi:MAG: IS6 family transposase [Candidatus Diapherotrites archaeon]
MDSREIRGLAIIAKGDVPVAVSKEEFLVPSQSGNGKYEVKHIDGWQCSCPDFKARGVKCKHIHATEFFLKAKHKTELDGFDLEKEVNENKDECPFCWSNKIVKVGFRKNKNGAKQKLYCQSCGKNFVKTPIKYCKADAKIITLAMDLYFKGLSLRDISDTIYQFYNIRIHFDTIRRWINKFTAKIEQYTNKFTPQLSGQFHSDEQMVKSKGKWVYAWNTIDHSTRYVLASTLTEGRTVKDARKHFNEVKENNANAIEPKYIITDKLRTYSKAIGKEFRTKSQRTKHISIVGRRKIINNNLVERYHNEFREFDKVRRGFKSNASTQKWLNGHRVYHNFVKNNSTIGKTPAEKAGINLQLERNKWLSLIEKSL